MNTQVSDRKNKRPSANKRRRLVILENGQDPGKRRKAGCGLAFLVAKIFYGACK